MSEEVVDFFIFQTKEEYYTKKAEWARREVPEHILKQMRDDALAYLDYAIVVLEKGEKFDIGKAIKLHDKIKSWEPWQFPLKKGYCE